MNVKNRVGIAYFGEGERTDENRRTSGNKSFHIETRWRLNESVVKVGSVHGEGCEGDD